MTAVGFRTDSTDGTHLLAEYDGAEGPAGSASGSQVDLSSFSAEDLVAWAANQLLGIDTQMHGIVAEVQQNSIRSSLFSQVSADVARFQSDNPSSGTSSAVLNTDALFQFNFPDGHSEDLSLHDALAAAGYNTDSLAASYSNTTVGNLSSSLNTFGQSMGDNSEQLSMSLQALASRRSQVTQMASQLIASLNDTASKVVGNIH